MRGSAVGTTFNGSLAILGGAVSVLASEAATTLSGDFTEVAIDLSESTFATNLAMSGGALSLFGHIGFPDMYTATVDGCRFASNVASKYGGALYATDWRFALSGGAFVGNVGQDGAAIYCAPAPGA